MRNWGQSPRDGVADRDPTCGEALPVMNAPVAPLSTSSTGGGATLTSG